VPQGDAASISKQQIVRFTGDSPRDSGHRFGQNRRATAFPHGLQEFRNGQHRPKSDNPIDGQSAEGSRTILALEYESRQFRYEAKKHTYYGKVEHHQRARKGTDRGRMNALGLLKLLNVGAIAIAGHAIVGPISRRQPVWRARHEKLAAGR
jgi:hypothetical protein